MASYAFFNSTSTGTLVTNRRTILHSVYVDQVEAGATGVVTIHDTGTATGTGTVVVVRQDGSVTTPVPVNCHDTELRSGLRVAITGSVQATVFYS